MIVAESFEPGARVSAVARRHALLPQQLFTWRRERRKAAGTAPAFVPAVIEAAVAEPKPARQSAKRRRRTRRSSGGSDGIEFEIDGVVVRIGSGARPKAIGALKAGS